MSTDTFKPGAARALFLSTTAFAASFAVWVLIAALAPQLLWALVPMAIVWLWFSLKLKRRLGGYTGDCLGAMQQLCELAFYLGILGLSA